ncbi:hypothetical protein WICPIJ_000972 [Wickerhamomyces pijperi]|uniref:Uncharacterized protein n=1 Tax=Wickerhamomyces pijperi TaxID=599730 RepID=A0A9P8QEP7_WICPI|nr:hypothetical protein WICPIJ_000972 [Wickerhamomyces pijperi]
MYSKTNSSWSNSDNFPIIINGFSSKDNSIMKSTISPLPKFNLQWYDSNTAPKFRTWDFLQICEFQFVSSIDRVKLFSARDNR